jgi:signal transduction histidine kinase
MRREYLPLLLFALSLCVAGQSGAQSLSMPGLPMYWEHFSGHDLRGLPQSWAVAQDASGIVYVGHRNGVLVFDGHSWETVTVPNHPTVRSLAARGDRVYVGAQGEFGYVERDAAGVYHYVSLADSLAADYRSFTDDVWGTHIAADEVLFQTRDFLYKWNGKSIDHYRAPSSFRTSFSVHDRFYVRDRDRGLLTFADNSLVDAENGKFFVDRQVFVMLPYDHERVLIGTREEGLFVYGPGTLQPLKTEADEWLRTYRLYSGAKAGDHYVLGTLGGGVAIIHRDGSVYQILDEEMGLPDGWVNFVYTDQQGGVWLALHNRGLVRLDVPAPITVFDERHGLNGLINNIARNESGLVVSSSAGVFQLGDSRATRAGEQRFVRRPVAELGYISIEARDYELVGTNQGLVVYRKGSIDTLNVGAVYAVAESRDNETRYLATGRGVAVFDFVAGTPHVTSLPQITDEISWIVADPKNRIWAVSRTRSVYRIESVAGEYHVRRFGIEHGVPGGDFTMTRYGDEVGIVAGNGIYRFDENEGRFRRDERFAGTDADDASIISALIEDDEGRIWLVRRPDRVDVYTPDGRGGFVSSSPAVLSFPEWNTTQVFVDRDGIVWLSNDYKLYRFDPSFKTTKTYQADVAPVIRHVTLVESGGRLASQTPASLSAPGLPRVDHRNNAIRFDFSLPSYNDPAGNEYQFFLEGHDRGWSAWTPSSNKSYTNLKEGRYRFRVRGRNAQGMVSPESYYTFHVMPPWFRTTWAYIAYILLISILAGFVVQYRRMSVAHRRSQRQAEELERERSVNERLQESYRRLQEANQSLLQADKLKDEFLANTSHELRTPLTAILGFASILKDEVEGEHQEFMEMIEENGKRLLHTLNSLLDLAKLRVGMMETDMKPVDVTTCAHAVGRLLMPLARKKAISLVVTAPSTALYSLLDTHCAERILYNLIGNAIKFTDEGGVSVTVEESGDDIAVTVRDTGIGIEEEFIPQLFDEFRQESSGLTREHEGSGLGLAITNRLVMLMNGSISVSSKKGAGSTFQVRFPRYRSAESSEVPEDADAASVVN